MNITSNIEQGAVTKWFFCYSPFYSILIDAGQAKIFFNLCRVGSLRISFVSSASYFFASQGLFLDPWFSATQSCVLSVEASSFHQPFQSRHELYGIWIRFPHRKRFCYNFTHVILSDSNISIYRQRSIYILILQQKFISPISGNTVNQFPAFIIRQFFDMRYLFYRIIVELVPEFVQDDCQLCLVCKLKFISPVSSFDIRQDFGRAFLHRIYFIFLFI